MLVVVGALAYTGSSLLLNREGVHEVRSLVGGLLVRGPVGEKRE